MSSYTQQAISRLSISPSLQMTKIQQRLPFTRTNSNQTAEAIRSHKRAARGDHSNGDRTDLLGDVTRSKPGPEHAGAPDTGCSPDLASIHATRLRRHRSGPSGAQPPPCHHTPSGSGYPPSGSGYPPSARARVTVASVSSRRVNAAKPSTRPRRSRRRSERRSSPQTSRSWAAACAAASRELRPSST